MVVEALIIAGGIFAGCFIVASALCFVGHILNSWLEQIDQSMMCYLAIMRTQLRIEIGEAGYELPEWLEDGFDEEDEDVPKKGPGQIIQLVKKGNEDEEKGED